MNLIDTNIFLEILLSQNKKEICKNFLVQNQGRLNISDFSLYSVGIVLFKGKLFDDYANFFQNITRNLFIKSLPIEQHSDIIHSSKKLNLDFDDSYQYNVAKFYGLKIITMDKDFKKDKDIEVIFL